MFPCAFFALKRFQGGNMLFIQSEALKTGLLRISYKFIIC